MPAAKVSPAKFDAKLVTLSAPMKKQKKSKDGKTSSTIASTLLYNGNTVIIEAPYLIAPFGVTQYEKGDSGSKDWSLNLQQSPHFDSSMSEKDKESEKILVEKWFDQWRAIDEMMIDFGLQHSKMLFGKEYNKDQRGNVEDRYTPIVKKSTSESGAYPDRIQPKIYANREDMKKPDMNCFNTDLEKVEIDSFEELTKLLPKGSAPKTMLIPRIWFISGKFGLTLSVNQMVLPIVHQIDMSQPLFSDIVPKKKSPPEPEIVNDSDEEVETSEIKVEDEDDDNNEEEEVSVKEPTPEPMPEPEPEPVVAKTARKGPAKKK
jgi:hypothetical protein